MNEVTKEEVLAGDNVPAINCILERTHASSTVGFAYTTRPDNTCATGQTRSNKYYHRAHNNRIPGRAPTNVPVVEEVGTFHLLRPELQHSHMITVMAYAKVGWEVFDRNLLRQYTKRRTKAEEGLEVTYDVAMEDHMVAIYFLDQYNSHRCWLTEAKARFIFKHLGSKTRRLEAVKEQIFIWYIGCGMDSNNCRRIGASLGTSMVSASGSTTSRKCWNSSLAVKPRSFNDQA